MGLAGFPGGSAGGGASSVAAADITDAGAVGVDLVQAATRRDALEALGPAISTTGAVLVLDPDDSARVTLVSGRVSAIASQVGALSVTQSTVGDRPLLVSAALNGRAIVASSPGDYLSVTSAALDLADPILLAVARVTTVGGASTLAGVIDAPPTYARWSLYFGGASTSDRRIDTDTTTDTVSRTDGGRTAAQWQIYAYRLATREMIADGLLVSDGADRTPTYPASPYETIVMGAGGECAWLAIYDGAAALSGTTFADWALSQSAALSARFGLPLRPS